ncbi:ABC transporter permease [Anaeromicropila herbilytica]|uniref:ABC transporter permease n=1 Tax=Anaeromicropila herbilytica TaxID=2785025 RepID=A0A7R7ENB5_9FIRM|nr:ABC transporter permease [Anaeromicropila herbilytica]BCN31667.1 ABC transporter permease [Anaeromicropila herbilytica]
MLYRILKKDLKHKRGINVILFLFMILATVFVASSVNNILVISNAMNYCMDKGKVAEEFVSTYEKPGEKNLGEWLKGNKLVKDYSKNEAVILSIDNIESYGGKDGSKYNLNNTIMIQNQWHDNMLIFDKDGKLVKMKDGEIGMQQKQLDLNGLKIGDTIKMKFGNLNKTFKITTSIMDPAFGGDYVGMSRYIISDKDFEDIKNTGTAINYNYNINPYDKAAFSKAMNKEAFDMIVSVQKDMFQFAYVMSLITAGVLIVVGVCLIIISFLILRFTIVFTLQEDYKEIGIMKAIGIKNFMIKKIYLIKYFALVSVAAVIGCFLSIPVSNAMTQSVGESIMMEDASVNFGINVICSVVVAVIVIIICYLCTNKLRKFSAIEAIRSGQTGERFHKKSKISLHKCKRLRTPLFMALNDILSNIKRYVVLILTFAIGTIVIILPINTITSLGSDEMAKNFLIDLKADFYAKSEIKSDNVEATLDRDTVLNHIRSMEDNFKSKHYDIDINTMIFYSFSYYVNDKDDSYQVMTLLPLESDGSSIELTGGSTPVNDNEIALSEKVMKQMGVKIGDTIHAKIGTEDRSFIITASYQNYMSMGHSAFMSNNVKLEGTISGVWYYQCYLNNKTFDNNMLKHIKKDFPEYKIYNVKQAMEVQLGSTTSQIGSVKVMIFVLICLVNVMITTLMMKIFIMSEKSQIAMLRSIGYSLKEVRLWQVCRIGIVLLIGVVLGAVLSIPLNDIALRPIFGMMGATHMRIQVNPFEVYLLCPILLLLVISLTAYISSGSIKKLNLMEINNAE